MKKKRVSKQLAKVASSPAPKVKQPVAFKPTIYVVGFSDEKPLAVEWTDCPRKAKLIEELWRGSGLTVHVLETDRKVGGVVA